MACTVVRERDARKKSLGLARDASEGDGAKIVDDTVIVC